MLSKKEQKNAVLMNDLFPANVVSTKIKNFFLQLNGIDEANTHNCHKLEFDIY